MDIAKFDGLAERFEEGRKVEILHPVTGEKVGLWVRVVSYSSKRCMKIQARWEQETFDQVTGQNRKKKNPKYTPSARSLELVSSAVVAWNAELDGKPLECTPDNVRDTLGNPDLWFVKDQVDQEASDEQAFLSSSPTTSVSRSKPPSPTT